MIDIENTLQLWSFLVLLSILLFIFFGGLWVTIQSRLYHTRNDAAGLGFPAENAAVSFTEADPQPVESLSATEEAKNKDQILYLHRTSPRRRP